MVELLELMAKQAHRMELSQSEAAHLARHAADVIRALIKTKE